MSSMYNYVDNYEIGLKCCFNSLIVVNFISELVLKQKRDRTLLLDLL